ncbi:MAG: hypothetical protein Kow0068_23220 [Marinilabiliales bacterium]
MYPNNIIQLDASGSDIKLYPNPCFDELHISGPQEYDMKSIEIYNCQGKMVSVFNPAKIIRIKSLKSGIYLLKITTKDELYYNRTFIKQ